MQLHKRRDAMNRRLSRQKTLRKQRGTPCSKNQGVFFSFMRFA